MASPFWGHKLIRVAADADGIPPCRRWDTMAVLGAFSRLYLLFCPLPPRLLRRPQSPLAQSRCRIDLAIGRARHASTAPIGGQPCRARCAPFSFFLLLCSNSSVYAFQGQAHAARPSKKNGPFSRLKLKEAPSLESQVRGPGSGRVQ